MLTTKPRRASYVVAAVLLVFLFFYLASSPTPSDHGVHQRAFSWTRSDPKSQVALTETETTDAIPEALGAEDKEESGFNELVFSFQNDLTQYEQPRDLGSYAQLPPKNLDPSAKDHGPTFATYLSTRNSSVFDPYFLATEHLVYRTLWKPESETRKGYPFTVFVAPFIPQAQRHLLAGAGANVVELPLIGWKPTVSIWARWRDLFSKLHMWAQTQFSLIAFLDSDAFPLRPLDDIFDVSKPQRCKQQLLTNKEDQRKEEEICDYVFAGVRMMYIEEINVGVTVFNPNKAMHSRLVRESSDPNNFDNNMAEQAFLNKYFGKDSAFPTQFIPREYNGFFATREEEHSLKVIHEKLWAFTGAADWAEGIFEKTHAEMLRFYESSDFRARRKSEAGKTGAQLKKQGGY